MINLILATLIATTQICPMCKHTYHVGEKLSTRQMRELITTVSRHNEFGITRNNREYLIKISEKETTTFNPVAKNKNSSAFGLFQFLSSTWKGVNEKKTSCPRCQIRAAIKYCRQRYGSIEKAYQFRIKHGYY